MTPLKISVAFGYYLLLSGAGGERTDVGVVAELASTEDSESSTDFGQTIRSRFEMHHVLWRQSLGDRRIEHIPLPTAVKEKFKPVRELYAGSFGEAWAATDISTGKRVVVKMFYTTVNGMHRHITWSMASNDEKLQTALKDAAGECVSAKDMQQYANEDPIGASRLMQCYEDHVTLGTSVSGHTVTQTQELFQVLEDCGGMPLSKWMQQSVEEMDAQTYLYASIPLIKQLMEGLKYLTNPSHDVKWVHHDLKPDNLVVKEFRDKQTQRMSHVLKIIDFGSVAKVSERASQEMRASTIMYAPPEWFQSKFRGFDYLHPSSFDTYQAGTILYELITGELFYDKLAALAPHPEEDLLAKCDLRQIGKVTLENMKAKQKMTRKACKQKETWNIIKGDMQARGTEFDSTGYWGKGGWVLPHAEPHLATYWINGMPYLATGDRYEAQGTQRLRVIPVRDAAFVSWQKAMTSQTTNLMVNFFHSGSGKFADVMNLYLERAHRYKDWHSTFMKIVAFDTAYRATPTEILATPFLNSFPLIQDPDYSAEQAQMPWAKPISQHSSENQNKETPKTGKWDFQLSEMEPQICPDFINRVCNEQHHCSYNKVWMCIQLPGGKWRVIDSE